MRAFFFAWNCRIVVFAEKRFLWGNNFYRGLLSYDADFAFMEGKGEFCTIHGEDCAFKEKKNCFLHKSKRRNFPFTVGNKENLYKTQRYDIHRVLTVETLKNRCSNICILRGHTERTRARGLFFGGNKKRNEENF